jgi:ribosomal protein S18 acetylase RimI-like enzyme
MTQILDLDATDPRMTVAAAKLLVQSVPDAAAGLVPYGSESYHRYLTAMLSPPKSLRTVVVRTVLHDETPIAVADWRLLDTTLFLNGLSVGADFRGGGLGRRLLDDGVHLARAFGVAQLALDVTVGNEAAYALYRRSGFADSTESFWHHVPIRGSGSYLEQARVIDWPAFSASRAAYGFADLSMRGADGGVASVRVIGKAIRLSADSSVGISGAQLCSMTDCTRAYAVGSSMDQAFLRFVRMTRPTRGDGHGDPRR